MNDLTRDELIKHVVSSLDIPQYLHSHEAGQGIGPSDPTFSQEYNRDRAEREAEAIAELISMDDAGLRELSYDLQAQKVFQLRMGLRDLPEWYSGGFSVAGFEPDWSHWNMMEFWSLEEATCLSIGFRPQEMPPNYHGENHPSKPLQFFWKRKELIRRSGCTEDGFFGDVRPNRLADWARKNGVEVPDGLLRIAKPAPTAKPGMIKTVDARLYDSALKVILGLLAGCYGDEAGEVSQQARDDLKMGLTKIGINLDPKTQKSVLAAATESSARFLEEQARRDEEKS